MGGLMGSDFVISPASSLSYFIFRRTLPHGHPAARFLAALTKGTDAQNWDQSSRNRLGLCSRKRFVSLKLIQRFCKKNVNCNFGLLSSSNATVTYHIYCEHIIFVLIITIDSDFYLNPSPPSQRSAHCCYPWWLSMCSPRAEDSNPRACFL